MSIPSDHRVREQTLQRNIIEPLVEARRSHGVISYGTSPWGCDARMTLPKVGPEIESAAS